MTTIPPSRCQGASGRPFDIDCLHLWRPVGVELPRPSAAMVGILA